MFNKIFHWAMKILGAISVSLLLFNLEVGALNVEYFVNVKPAAVLRAKANINSDKITDIAYGTKIQIIERGQSEVLILGTNGFWFKIRVKGKEGWIFSRLVANHTQHPAKVMHGQLVPAKWQEELMPRLAKKIPAAPAGCESIEHYLFTRFKPTTDLKMEKNPKTMTWVRERKFDKTINYKNAYGMDWQEEQVEIPGVSDIELFQLAESCFDLGKITPPTKKRDGGFRYCKTVSDEGRTNGFLNIETSVKSTGVVLYVRSSAHEVCPKQDLH